MIPAWLYNWIETKEDPITDTVCCTPDIGDIDNVDEGREEYDDFSMEDTAA